MGTPPASPLDAPYDPKAIDPAAQALWERERCHAFDPDPANRAPVFSIDTPPPTVSGALHIGHFFSYTQAESIARYKRMRGFNVFYPFGFDGNGLPTERLAEQEHGVKGKDMPRPDFVRLCLQTSAKYEREFETMMRSVGLSADWSLAYSTIDDRCVRISQRGFLDLWRQGEAYLKEAPTFWCTQCGTALAQADLEFVDKPSQFTTLRFDLVGGGSIEIATTRPELLPACGAMFLHPSHPRARELLGRRALVPLESGRDVAILADEKVDPEKGTGIVMCCTFGDKTDVEWFKKHGLALRQAVGRDGHMTALAGPEKGLFVNKARKAILERLAAAGHVGAQKDIVHPVATHERCKTDVQFLATKQVFVRVLDKKAELVALGERVRWHPDFMGKRYRDWVENLEWDWCISRQRFYGVPFPLWHCKACGAPTVARDEDLPVDPTTRGPATACASCGGTDFDPERDVMDTWATSSETPQINARFGDGGTAPRAPLPMSLRPQAHEIIRTWAFYTLVKSYVHHRDVPWRDAMISGWMLAADRDKISKSKGNAPTDPKALLAKHGADAVRYWALSAKLGTDYPFNEEDMASGRRLCVKLWNVAKLALGHLADYDPVAERAPERPIDAWVERRLGEVVDEATALLETFEFGLAKKRVEDFFWNDFCDNWLEMVKGRLYEPRSPAERRTAQHVLHTIVYAVLRLFSPFVPHVTEAIYQAGFRARVGTPSLTRTPWPESGPLYGALPRGAAAPGDAAVFGHPGFLAVAVLGLIRRWRSEQKVSPARPIPRVAVTLPPVGVAMFAAIADDVVAAGRVEAFDLVAGPSDLDGPRVEVTVPPPPVPPAPTA